MTNLLVQSLTNTGLTEIESYDIARKIESKPHLLEKLQKGTLNFDSCSLVFKDWVNLINTRIIIDSMEAIKLKTPTLTQLKFYSNEAYALGVIVVLVKDVLDNLCITGTMNDQQIGMAAKMILAEYSNYKISELRYVFINGIKGVYGKNYNRIDISILMEWIRTYDTTERDLNIEKIQIEKQRKAQSETAVFFNAIPAEMKEKFLNLTKELDAQSNEKIKNKIAAKITSLSVFYKKTFDEMLNDYNKKYIESKSEKTFNEYLVEVLNIEL